MYENSIDKSEEKKDCRQPQSFVHRLRVLSSTSLDHVSFKLSKKCTGAPFKRDLKINFFKPNRFQAN